MVETARHFASPSWPARRFPSRGGFRPVDFPFGGEAPTEVLAIGYGNVDSYDFHVLETIQCMVERRHGGETGVAAVQAIRGDDVWRRMQAGSWKAGGWDPALFDACVVPQHPPRVRPAPATATSFPRRPTSASWSKRPSPTASNITDGLKATMLLLNGLVTDMTFAARMQGGDCHLDRSCTCRTARCAISSARSSTRPKRCSSPASRPRPIERTLLTTGLTAAGVESLWQGQKRIETPHLAIRYQADHESTLLENVMLTRREFLGTSGCSPGAGGPAVRGAAAESTAQAETPGPDLDALDLPVAHAAHRRPVPRRLSARGQMAPARNGRRRRIRRSKAGRRPERRAGPLFRLQGLPDDHRRPCAAAATSWPSTPCSSSASTATIRTTKRAKSSIRAMSSSNSASSVFERDGRAVPVYNDKHLSYSFAQSEGDGRRLEAARLPDARRLVAAGNLATA